MIALTQMETWSIGFAEAELSENGVPREARYPNYCCLWAALLQHHPGGIPQRPNWSREFKNGFSNCWLLWHCIASLWTLLVGGNHSPGKEQDATAEVLYVTHGLQRVSAGLGRYLCFVLFSSWSLRSQSLSNKRKIPSSTNPCNRNCSVTYLTDMQIKLHDLFLY